MNNYQERMEGGGFEPMIGRKFLADSTPKCDGSVWYAAEAPEAPDDSIVTEPHISTGGKVNRLWFRTRAANFF
jgi:hypothetical protein